MAAMILKAHEDKTYTRRDDRLALRPVGRRRERQRAERRRLSPRLVARPLSGRDGLRGVRRQGFGRTARSTTSSASSRSRTAVSRRTPGSTAAPSGARSRWTRWPTRSSSPTSSAAPTARLTTKHVRPAADFIVRHGPYTPQERWEEKSGYSPSTIAAEIAGLVCAAEIARAQRRRGVGQHLSRRGRRLGAQRRALDGDDHRPATATATTTSASPTTKTRTTAQPLRRQQRRRHVRRTRDR